MTRTNSTVELSASCREEELAQKNKELDAEVNKTKPDFDEVSRLAAEIKELESLINEIRLSIADVTAPVLLNTKGDLKISGDQVVLRKNPNNGTAADDHVKIAVSINEPNVGTEITFDENSTIGLSTAVKDAEHVLCGNKISETNVFNVMTALGEWSRQNVDKVIESPQDLSDAVQEWKGNPTSTRATSADVTEFLQKEFNPEAQHDFVSMDGGGDAGARDGPVETVVYYDYDTMDMCGLAGSRILSVKYGLGTPSSGEMTQFVTEIDDVRPGYEGKKRSLADLLQELMDSDEYGGKGCIFLAGSGSPAWTPDVTWDTAFGGVHTLRGMVDPYEYQYKRFVCTYVPVVSPADVTKYMLWSFETSANISTYLENCDTPWKQSDLNDSTWSTATDAQMKKKTGIDTVLTLTKERNNLGNSAYLFNVKSSCRLAKNLLTMGTSLSTAVREQKHNMVEMKRDIQQQTQVVSLEAFDGRIDTIFFGAQQAINIGEGSNAAKPVTNDNLAKHLEMGLALFSKELMSDIDHASICHPDLLGNLDANITFMIGVMHAGDNDNESVLPVCYPVTKNMKSHIVSQLQADIDTLNMPPIIAVGKTQSYTGVDGHEYKSQLFVLDTTTSPNRTATSSDDGISAQELVLAELAEDVDTAVAKYSQTLVIRVIQTKYKPDDGGSFMGTVKSEELVLNYMAQINNTTNNTFNESYLTESELNAVNKDHDTDQVEPLIESPQLPAWCAELVAKYVLFKWNLSSSKVARPGTFITMVQPHNKQTNVEYHVTEVPLTRDEFEEFLETPDPGDIYSRRYVKCHASFQNKDDWQQLVNVVQAARLRKQDSFGNDIGLGVSQAAVIGSKIEMDVYPIPKEAPVKTSLFQWIPSLISPDNDFAEIVREIEQELSNDSGFNESLFIAGNPDNWIPNPLKDDKGMIRLDTRTGAPLYQLNEHFIEIDGRTGLMNDQKPGRDDVSWSEGGYKAYWAYATVPTDDLQKSLMNLRREIKETIKVNKLSASGITQDFEDWSTYCAGMANTIKTGAVESLAAISSEYQAQNLKMTTNFTNVQNNLSTALDTYTEAFEQQRNINDLYVGGGYDKDNDFGYGDQARQHINNNRTLLADIVGMLSMNFNLNMENYPNIKALVDRGALKNNLPLFSVWAVQNGFPVNREYGWQPCECHDKEISNAMRRLFRSGRPSGNNDQRSALKNLKIGQNGSARSGTIELLPQDVWKFKQPPKLKVHDNSGAGDDEEAVQEGTQ